LVKSKVDEKNLDEEIGKIKEKLAAKVAERIANTTKPTAPTNPDDDFFNSVPDRIVAQPPAPSNGASRGGRRKAAVADEMDIDFDTTTTTTARTAGKKRVVHELSEDDDFMTAPTTKKARTTAGASTAKRAPVSRSRRSSESSNPPLTVRKTPSRAAASRSKKVPPHLPSLVLTVDDC
jgi:hypothetical protein